MGLLFEDKERDSPLFCLLSKGGSTLKTAKKANRIQNTAPEKRKKKRKPPSQKRLELRESLWPESENWIWDRHSNDGFTTIPRILPLVMGLMKKISNPGDPSMVYLDLWSRMFDEAIITVTDEETYAFSSGYTGTRAVRTWRERILRLSELGFIKVKPEGLREIGQILVLNPLSICSRLKKTTGNVPDEWWNAFLHRVNEIGASISDLPDNAFQK